MMDLALWALVCFITLCLLKFTDDLIGDQMKDNNTGPACKKCNDTGYIVIRSHNGRYARPGPVPDDARGYAEARCFECLANPGGFDGPTGAE